MKRLREFLLSINLEKASFNKSRVANLLDDIAAMLGESDPVLSVDDVLSLKERLRDHLKGGNAATASNKVYRLNRLIELATEQGLLPPRECIPLPPRPKRGAERRRYMGLAAFNAWCAEKGLQLTDITEDTFREYRDELKPAGTTFSEDRYNCAVKSWHELAAGNVVHDLHPPRWNNDSKENYGLSRSAWPDRIEDDFDRYCRAASGQARPGEKRRRSLRPDSLADIEREVSRLLGYLTNVRGQEIGMRSLNEILSDEDSVIDYISWHIATRTGGQERTHHGETLNWFASLLKWGEGDENIILTYRLTAKSLRTTRARDPFPEKPITYEQFSSAAQKALEKAKRNWLALGEITGRTQKAISAAVACRDAMLFAFLVCRPMRSRNMREMKLGTNLHAAGGKWRLRFTSEEMKGGEYACQFPAVLVEHLEFYLNKARPFLDQGGEGKEVFLTKSGRQIGRTDFWKVMVKAGERIMGLETNPHLFRYLIPSAYLLRFPNRPLEMQALLGHSVLETTLRYYVHVYSRVASQRAAEVLRQHCPAMAELGSLFPPTANI